MHIRNNVNVIVCGDCHDWLKHVPSNSVDLAYIDPPFFSNKNYEIVWGNGYEVRSFGDRWKGGIKFYVEWMRLRVQEIHRVLKPTGSILLHCDWHASHRLRCMLDDVFDESNFINEIIWCYRSGGATSKRFSRKHDNIYFYGKSRRFTYNPTQEKSYMGNGYSTGNKKVKLYKDDKECCLGPYTKVNGKDWLEFGMLATSSKERIGYRTQKPEALLKKLIESCSKYGDVILDCFGGGGTTAAVCWKTGRKFITGDVSPVACKVMAGRLEKIGCKPHILNLPRTRSEWLNMCGHEFAERICNLQGWEVNPKKTNDGGVDGWADNRRVPIQIKNHTNKIGRPELHKFIGAMNGSTEGIFVAWQFTPTFYDAIVGAKEDHGKIIKAIQVKDLLGPLLIEFGKLVEIEDYFKKFKTRLAA